MIRPEFCSQGADKSLRSTSCGLNRDAKHSGRQIQQAFCIKVGTSVTFMTSSKNTGFVIDFGGTDLFDHPGAIIGGADRTITVTAKHSGCYTYSVGACTPGTVCGMCGNANNNGKSLNPSLGIPLVD